MLSQVMLIVQSLFRQLRSGVESGGAIGHAGDYFQDDAPNPTPKVE